MFRAVGSADIVSPAERIIAVAVGFPLGVDVGVVG